LSFSAVPDPCSIDLSVEQQIKAPTMNSEFIMPASPETTEFLDAIVDEMVSEFKVTRAEAIARINEQWCGQDLSGEDCLILHEEESYWAFVVYYGGNVPDWSPNADRTAWLPKPPPVSDSGLWTNPT
jgi:hypothetical protein